MGSPKKDTAVKRRAIANGYTSSKYSDELGGTTGRSAMLKEEKWDRENKPNTAEEERKRQKERLKKLAFSSNKRKKQRKKKKLRGETPVM